MSRSIQKSKKFGYTSAVSEKEDKRIYNRRFRRICKQLKISDVSLFPLKREISNVWCFSKDGKFDYKVLDDFSSCFSLFYSLEQNN